MSEQDIRSKFITPAIVKGDWNLLLRFGDLIEDIFKDFTETVGRRLEDMSLYPVEVKIKGE